MSFDWFSPSPASSASKTSTVTLGNPLVDLDAPANSNQGTVAPIFVNYKSCCKTDPKNGSGPSVSSGVPLKFNNSDIGVNNDLRVHPLLADAGFLSDLCATHADGLAIDIEATVPVGTALDVYGNSVPHHSDAASSQASRHKTVLKLALPASCEPALLSATCEVIGAEPTTAEMKSFDSNFFINDGGAAAASRSSEASSAMAAAAAPSPTGLFDFGCRGEFGKKRCSSMASIPRHEDYVNRRLFRSSSSSSPLSPNGSSENGEEEEACDGDVNGGRSVNIFHLVWANKNLYTSGSAPLLDLDGLEGDPNATMTALDDRAKEDRVSKHRTTVLPVRLRMVVFFRHCVNRSFIHSMAAFRQIKEREEQQQPAAAVDDDDNHTTGGDDATTTYRHWIRSVSLLPSELQAEILSYLHPLVGYSARETKRLFTKQRDRHPVAKFPVGHSLLNQVNTDLVDDLSRCTPLTRLACSSRQRTTTSAASMLYSCPSSWWKDAHVTCFSPLRLETISPSSSSSAAAVHKNVQTSGEERRVAPSVGSSVFRLTQKGDYVFDDEVWGGSMERTLLPEASIGFEVFLKTESGFKISIPKLRKRRIAFILGLDSAFQQKPDANSWGEAAPQVGGNAPRRGIRVNGVLLQPTGQLVSFPDNNGNTDDDASLHVECSTPNLRFFFESGVRSLLGLEGGSGGEHHPLPPLPSAAEVMKRPDWMHLLMGYDVPAINNNNDDDSASQEQSCSTNQLSVSVLLTSNAQHLSSPPKKINVSLGSTVTLEHLLGAEEFATLCEMKSASRTQQQHESGDLVEDPTAILQREIAGIVIRGKNIRLPARLALKETPKSQSYHLPLLRLGSGLPPLHQLMGHFSSPGNVEGSTRFIELRLASSNASKNSTTIGTVFASPPGAEHRAAAAKRPISMNSLPEWFQDHNGSEAACSGKAFISPSENQCTLSESTTAGFEIQTCLTQNFSWGGKTPLSFCIDSEFVNISDLTLIFLTPVGSHELLLWNCRQICGDDQQ